MKTIAPSYETRRVKLSSVRDNPANARNVPTDEKGKMGYDKGVKDLADDMKANGNLAPMVVIQTDEPDMPYQVQEGSRRYAAFQLLEVEEVDVRIIPFKDKLDRELIGLAGNIDRENLTPYDVAMKLRDIKKEFPDTADNTLATRIGRSKGYVQNMLRLANNLHPKIVAQWAAGNGMATTDNLLKLAKEDKAEQWDRWRILCGEDAGPPTPGGNGAPPTPGADEPKRNAKKAAAFLLAAIAAEPAIKKDKAKGAAWTIQCLQYVLGIRESLPAGITADPKGQRGGTGANA